MCEVLCKTEQQIEAERQLNQSSQSKFKNILEVQITQEKVRREEEEKERRGNRVETPSTPANYYDMMRSMQLEKRDSNLALYEQAKKSKLVTFFL